MANQGGVIGCLWAADAEDAAGDEFKKSAGAGAANAGARWYRKLREAKAKGLLPSQALNQLAAGAGDPVTGRVVRGSEATAPGLSALTELAVD